MSGPIKGRADFLELGDYNASCSMCGRKRKARAMVRNWQGLWRCPEHNEPRQPQDFVRNIKDVMTVPWSQPQQDIFTTIEPTFPAQALPSFVNTVIAGGVIETTDTVPQPIETTGTGPEEIEITGAYSTTPSVQILTPGWIQVLSYAWTWNAGGVGIVINSPAGQTTNFSGQPGDSGVAQCLIVGVPAGEALSPPPRMQAVVLVPVSIP